MGVWSAEDIRALRLPGLHDGEIETIRALFGVWRSHYAKNMKRSVYYDTETAFKDLGITLPPQLRKARFYLGWATQAVRKPAMRSQFDGLRLPGSRDPFELGETLAANNFALYFGQSVVSAYTHGFSLVTVTQGETDRDGNVLEPVQIHAHAAENSAVLWNSGKRRPDAALTISLYDKSRPTEFVVYLPERVIKVSRTGLGWRVEGRENPTGRVLAVPITNDPQLRRPLGRARLTNSVMALNDMAVRAYVRMEANAEFYSTPQIALLGVDGDAFDNLSDTKKFKLAINRLLAISKDEDDDKPELKQLTQASMQPHSDMLRTIAMAFSGETGLPPSSLGVIHDQPASAEAIRAAEHDLLIDATFQNRYVFDTQIRDIMTLVVMLRDRLAAPPAEIWRLSSRFIDPEFASVSAQSDSVQKLSTSMDALVRYPVLLEQIFDDAQVKRIQDDQRRADGSATLERILANANANAGQRIGADSGDGGGEGSGGDGGLVAASAGGPDRGPQDA